MRHETPKDIDGPTKEGREDSRRNRRKLRTALSSNVQYMGDIRTEANRVVLVGVIIRGKRPFKRGGWGNPGLKLYNAL